MINPLHNNIFFDDFHRYVLQDVNLTILPPKTFPKRPFNIESVNKSSEKGKKGKNPKTKSEDSKEKA